MTQNVYGRFSVGERVRVDSVLYPTQEGVITEVLDDDELFYNWGRPHTVRLDDGVERRVYAKDLIPLPSIK